MGLVLQRRNTSLKIRSIKETCVCVCVLRRSLSISTNIRTRVGFEDNRRDMNGSFGKGDKKQIKDK